MDKKSIEKKLIKASDKYYNTNKLILSDEEYDKLKDYYLLNGGDESKIIGAYPLANNNNLSMNHKYLNLAGTLHKTNVKEEMKEFIRSRIKEYCLEMSLDPSLSRELQVSFDLKYDGNSVIGEYKDGVPVNFLTRGKDGLGLDLTEIFKGEEIEIKEECAVKYEAIVSYKNFKKILEDFPDTNYANPRSLVSGLLGRKDAKKFRKYVTLVPLEVRYKDNDGRTFDTIDAKLKLLNDFNSEIEVFEYKFTNKKSMELFESEICDEFDIYYNSIIEIRNDLPFMIDGLVVTVYSDWNVSDKNYINCIPNFSYALKFPYLEKLTKITDITFSLGDSGRITPMAHFEPVEFNGTIHNKQSLQNYKRYQELRLGIGSEVLIQFVNDVLTYIQPLANEYNSNIEPVLFTTKCPVCEGNVAIDYDEKGFGTLAYCTNPTCKGQVIGRINNFITKIGVKGLKTTSINKLYENNLLNNGIESLFNLKRNDVVNINGLGESAWEIIESIQDKRFYDYEILGSIMIKNISIKNAKEFCKLFDLKTTIYSISDIMNEEYPEYKNLDEYKSKCITKFKTIPGYSDIMAKYIFEGMVLNLPLIYRLMGTCKNLRDDIKTSENSLTVVMSGIRSKEIEEYIENNGGKVVGSVSKKTDILIVKDKSASTSKIKKAKDLGIPILLIDEFKSKYLA